MHEIVNQFLLAGDKFTTETHLRKPGFMCSACIYKHDIFIKTNYIKLVFNMTWLMEILKI